MPTEIRIVKAGHRHRSKARCDTGRIPLSSYPVRKEPPPPCDDCTDLTCGIFSCPLHDWWAQQQEAAQQPPRKRRPKPRRWTKRQIVALIRKVMVDELPDAFKVLMEATK